MLVTVHLDPPMLASARSGQFNFLNRLRAAVEETGARLRFRREGAPRGDLTLWHMRAPEDAPPGALIFRRAYHYPFWNIEARPERWRWPVARAVFAPGDAGAARDFAARLRRRVWPGVEAIAGGEVLIPLQGQIGACRSFQTMTPLQMVEAVGRAGLPGCVTLHPREHYSTAERAALDAILSRHPGLRMGQDSRALLPGCLGVVTMNSAVGFDGLILGKPLVLFGQVDFHHVALTVAEIGAEAALAALPGHRPDFDAYLHWFLGHAVDAMAPDAAGRIRAALGRAGWRQFS